MEIIDYKRGEDKGAIICHDSKKFTAVTCATSKDYRTLRGAEKYMALYNYERV